MGCLQSKEDRAAKYAVKDGEYDITGQPLPPKPQPQAQPLAQPAPQPQLEPQPASQPPPSPSAIPAEDTSKPKESASGPGTPKAAVLGGIANYPSGRNRLDPKEFQFTGCSGENRIKLPGSINGQGFTIDNCQDCNIYLLDCCAQVTVDDCKNCRIFVGPTEGSVFIRDCVNCSFAVVCRQLRTRDCNGCNIALFCRTRPIVESSVNMGFCCYDLVFKQLGELMKSAKLGPWHNFWSHIYDFTPKEGNWNLLPPSGSHAVTLLSPMPPAAAVVLEHRPAAEPPVFVTHGETQPLPAGSYLLAVLPVSGAPQAHTLALEAGDQGWLLHANQATMSSDVAGQLCVEAGWPKQVQKELAAQVFISMEMVLPAKLLEVVQTRVEAAGGRCCASPGAGAMLRYLGLDG